PLTILEHHTLRDEQWKQKIALVYDAALRAGHKIMTAAEFAGEKNNFLESKRKQLYLEMPPSKEFENWSREVLTKKNIPKPPI
ncbi:MAG: hypothetical protein N3E52_04695, partial [Candidatus Bathyarchaeota archaeon]|nr:hypothetical protein [Candidatus Bathyarchaeota archaeon]